MSTRRWLVALLALLPAFPIAQQAPAPAKYPAPPDRFFDSKGVRIRYVEQGQGAPVVLLHGYTGTVDRHWITPGVFTALAADHRVVALDARGHGKSDKPHDPLAYGPEMGQDIIRLLDHLAIPRAHIVGYSMGAAVIGHLLTTNADRFMTATFVAYHPIYRITKADEDEAEATARELEGDTPFKSLVLYLYPPGKPLPSDDEIRTLVQPLVAANDVKALAAYNRGRRLRPMAVTGEQLAAVRVPTLGVIGSADPSVGGMRELATMMPALKAVILDGAEHGGERGVLRRPEFLPMVRQFFAAHQKR